MKRQLLFFSLFLPVFVLLIWVVCLSIERASGRDVKVVITGYDPRDLLAGRYIAYQIDWEKTDCGQFEGQTCPKDEFCREEKWGRQCRFYVPQNKAFFLDHLFRTRVQSGDVFEVIYAYKKHHTPIAKQLLINGQDWRKYKQS